MIALLMVDGARTWEAALRLEPAANRTDRFVALAANEMDRAYRIAGLLLTDAVEAEDAVGDALERAWTSLDQLRIRRGSKRGSTGSSSTGAGIGSGADGECVSSRWSRRSGAPNRVIRSGRSSTGTRSSG